MRKFLNNSTIKELKKFGFNTNNRTYIIAEIGINHRGDVNVAKKLIDAAADAKADFVKFQTSVPKLHISKFAKQANYQIKNFKVKSFNQLKMAEKLSLKYSDFIKLNSYCKKRNIKRRYKIRQQCFSHNFKK